MAPKPKKPSCWNCKKTQEQGEFQHRSIDLVICKECMAKRKLHVIEFTYFEENYLVKRLPPANALDSDYPEPIFYDGLLKNTDQ